MLMRVCGRSSIAAGVWLTVEIIREDSRTESKGSQKLGPQSLTLRAGRFAAALPLGLHLPDKPICFLLTVRRERSGRLVPQLLNSVWCQVMIDVFCCSRIRTNQNLSKFTIPTFSSNSARAGLGAFATALRRFSG